MLKFPIVLITFLGFISLYFDALAQKPKSTMPLGEIKVRVLKKRQAHIQTAALLCALIENGASEDQIQTAWRERLEIPISEDDQFLVRSVMSGMCPGITPQKSVYD